ncbi:MAG TPA: arsenate reductase [Parvularcula sp.]|nr:arsenate reductase [Parvularcula sp.]
MPAFEVYGLKSCYTCKRVRKELDAAEVPYTFHDLRDDGVTMAQVAGWAKSAGWEAMLNRSSTTWRALPGAQRTGLTETKAVALMAANPALIKRPLIAKGPTEVYVGWTDAVKAKVLSVSSARNPIRAVPASAALSDIRLRRHSKSEH